MEGKVDKEAQKLPPKAIPYTVGLVSRKRPFSTEAQIELSYKVEKGRSDSTFSD